MEFKGGWEQYAEDYCFIQNTFFVPFHEEIPADDEDRSKAVNSSLNPFYLREVLEGLGNTGKSSEGGYERCKIEQKSKYRFFSASLTVFCPNLYG